jgi:putative restriction endonuclease
MTGRGRPVDHLMKSAIEVLDAFEKIRRAQRAGVYAPHKPLLILLALARVQHGKPRLAEFGELDAPLMQLLEAFGPTRAAKSRHYPFWHLATDGQGAVWQLVGPRQVLQRPPASTPTLGELRSHHVQGGFPIELDEPLRHAPGLLEAVAGRVLDAFFPTTLHADIAAMAGLDLEGPAIASEPTPITETYVTSKRRQRDPAFRDRVLRAYEYRCCVCGFDLRIGSAPAALEAAHIQWHHIGGPDVERNGLALCALHHKLFDLGAFTVEPSGHRVVFSQHAISGERGMTGALEVHGRAIHPPQRAEFLAGTEFLAWNIKNVFKMPARGDLLAS